MAPPLARRPALGRLPWRAWLVLCAPDTASVVNEIARRSGRPLTFLQVGSNDGVTLDPIHHVVRRFGWTGAVIEPMPEPFGLLEANYADVPGVRAEQVAIGDTDGEVEIYSFVPDDDDPFWAPLLSSFDRDVICSHAYAIPDIEQRLRTQRVQMLRLDRLVDRVGLKSIDLLHVDAEGTDDLIVRQIPSDAPWRPTFVIYEKCHLSPGRHRELTAGLRSAGYRVHEIWPDEIAYRETPSAIRRER